ncbi:MAG: 4Fe-4S binding protein [Syntrophobacteraceae bacterium]
MATTRDKEKAAAKKGPAQKKSQALAADGKGPAEKKQYEIDIFRGWCKSCGICAAFCPKECIHLDEEGSPVVSDSGRCTGCGWCELHCPDFAVSIRRTDDRGRMTDDG